MGNTKLELIKSSGEKPELNPKKESEPKKRAGKNSGDSIRLWEKPKEMAIIWRSLALIQMPLTAGLIILSLIFFATADTVVDVPPKPEPGTYSVTKLPDAEFISVAQNVVNLVSTYQPFTARRQFMTARKYLWEPALSDFDKNYMSERDGSLVSVEKLGRTQQFRIDVPRIRVERFKGYVVVKIPGVRYKMFQTKHLPAEQVNWYIRMTTIPRNLHNEYGIVVNEMKLLKNNGSNKHSSDAQKTKKQKIKQSKA